CCVEAYMQFLKPGERSGKHRHMWEELIFVVEGEGYDLHWDMKFDCLDAFKWEWADVPKKFEWKRGDYIYIPPFTTHQHFSTTVATRFLVNSHRTVKEMGSDWFDKVQNAPGFYPDRQLPPVPEESHAYCDYGSRHRGRDIRRDFDADCGRSCTVAGRLLQRP